MKDEECLLKELNQNQRAKEGAKISKLAELTGGENISICSENYGAKLKQISHAIKSRMERSIRLKKLPLSDSVEVEFSGGVSIPWILSVKRLIFKGNLEKDTLITIRYLSSED